MAELETNKLYCGDCLKVLRSIPDNSVDLIYLDPPFFSQKSYENFWIKDKVSKLKFSDSKKHWEKLRSSINQNILREYDAIEARWKGGHKENYVYIAYMEERIEQCWRILKPTGSIYLHCDWHASHYLKVMMDKLFTSRGGQFLNEIVWAYGGWSGVKDKFVSKHDIIFFYSKSKINKFNIQYGEYSEKVKKRNAKGWFVGDVGKGKGKNGIMIYDQEKVDKAIKEGRLDLSKYAKVVDKTASKGPSLNDVWNIPFINPAAKERLGYPTQKPEELLDRIIKASSNEGDIVIDPFCGGGTTLSVAQKLNRKWIGIDISRTACDITRKRLGSKGIKLIGGETEKELSEMEPHEFARIMIVEKLNGTPNPKKTGDMGIDGWIDNMERPVQVKKWGTLKKPIKVGRPEIDKFKTAIERDGKTKGLIIAFDFSKDCYAEVARIKFVDKIDIYLRRVRDVIGLDYWGNSQIIL